MKRAFTLIELLVVIAIIAILAAILFPVFAQAKAAAKKTQALSNAKQVQLATIMYTNDSDDVYPMGSGNCWFYPTDGAWAWDTTPYIKSVGVLRDPSDTLSKQQWQSWFDPNATVAISFASNGFQNDTGSGWGLYGVMGMNQHKGQTTRCGDGWMTGPNCVRNGSEISQPASTVAFAGRYSSNNMFGTGDLIAGVNWWDSTGAGLIPNGTRDVSGFTNGYRAPVTAGGDYLVNANARFGAVATVYQNNGIFTFTDGHAKAMNPVQTNPDNNDQTKNMWNALR